MESLRNIINEGGITLAHTVYEESAVLDYPMPVDTGFALQKEHLDKPTYHKVIRYLSQLEYLLQSREHRELLEEIGAVSGSERDKKRTLRKQKKEMEAGMESRAFLNSFPGLAEETDVFSVSYKSGVHAIDLSELFDAGADPEMQRLMARPWFLSDIDWFVRMAYLPFRAGGIGMEGGPCILGTDEMLFRITCDGKEHVFDFNTMQELTGNEERVISHETDTALRDFVHANADRITAVSVVCEKDRITEDEYQQFLYLFLLARVFDARLVVTITDMSYEKTFRNIFECLGEALYEPLHAAFMEHITRIADTSIRWVGHFAKRYPVREYRILHGRNHELRSLLERERERYLDEHTEKHLTSTVDGRRDALLDYISMPAVPFYLWGTTDVIEVNRLEEYPSIEKCRHMHRGHMNLHAMLFPQEPCGNGTTSAFYARKQDKKYIGFPLDSGEMQT